MNKKRDLSFFEGKMKVKDLCREQMRILKKFNFKPQKIQSNKNKITRISLNRKNNQKKTLLVKNVIDEESPKPQPFIPPVPMDNPNKIEYLKNKNNSVVKNSNKKNDLAFSESPISSIYTDSGQISELTNILIPQLKVIQYPVTSVIEKKSVDKNPVNSHHYPPIISNKSPTPDKTSKYNIKINKSKPLIVNYISTSSSSTAIPTTLTSYNDNIFPLSDTPPFTPLPPQQKQSQQKKQIQTQSQLQTQTQTQTQQKQKEPQKKEENKSEHHLTTCIPTSISIPSTLTGGKSCLSTFTTTTSSSTVFTKRKTNNQSETSSSIPSVLGSSVVYINQKVGLDTPPPAPELLMNKDLLLPRRLRKEFSRVLEYSESSSSDLSLPIKHEVKSYLGSSSITNNNNVSFHPSLLSKTIKPTYSPVLSPNRKRNHRVVIKQSPLSSPYIHKNIPSPDSTSSSSCSLILENNNKNKLINNNFKIPNDNVSDILVKDIQFIIQSSRKSIESMKEDKSLKTIKEENTEEEEERSSINIKQQSCMKMNNVAKKIDFGSSESEEEDDDEDELEIIGYYPLKPSIPIKEEKSENDTRKVNEVKSIKEIKPIKETIQINETNQTNHAKSEKQTKLKEEKEIIDDIPLSKLVLPLPSFPIFSETDSQSDETKSTTSSSSMLSKLLNYSPKYMTRDEIEDKYNKVCFKYPPLFLDSDLLDL